MNNKKGISTIIATIMMILFVLIAAGVVWVIIQNLLTEQTEDISSGLERITLSIVEDSITLTDTQISLVITRDIGEGNLAKIKIILYNENDESYSENIDAGKLTEELGSQKFTISKGGFATIKKISIAPISESSGKESVGRIVDTYVFPG